MNPILRLLKSLFKKINYDLIKKKPYDVSKNFPEISEFEKELFDICSNYSMTSFDGMFSLMKSLDFIIQNNVDGDFVECGVWKGGNLIMFQKYIEKYNLNKKIYAYDTFEGMSEPAEIDKTFEGESASLQLDKLEKKKVDRKKNVEKYTTSTNLTSIKGKVEDTLINKKNLPNKISILRLDTDWYSSTKKELEILYPLLEKNGILYIDDYGYWQGARKAVDEFFKDKKVTMFKIDFTARMIINSK